MFLLQNDKINFLKKLIGIDAFFNSSVLLFSWLVCVNKRPVFNFFFVGVSFNNKFAKILVCYFVTLFFGRLLHRSKQFSNFLIFFWDVNIATWSLEMNFMEINDYADPSAEVIALSPNTLMATNRFICEICNKGFQRD